MSHSVSYCDVRRYTIGEGSVKVQKRKMLKEADTTRQSKTVPVPLDTGRVSNSDLEDVQFQTAPVHAGEGELLAVKDKEWGFKSIVLPLPF